MGKSKINKRVIATALTLSPLAWVGNAQAQEPEALPDTAIQEIIVTAERRSQNIQKTPIAISVRDGTTLAAQGRLSSIQRALEDVPSVNWTENTGTVTRNDTSATSLAIRGIGSNGAVSGNVISLVPSVAVYADDVLNGIGANYDISRVEVLRGPQGTLYGRSATAGVVAFHTQQPLLGEFGGNASTEYGSYDLFRVSGALNVPVGETLAVRVSGQHYEQDGFYSPEGDRLVTDSARAKVLFRPSDNFSLEAGAALENRKFHSGGETPQITPNGLIYSLVAPIGDGEDKQQQYWGKATLDLGPVTVTYIPALRYYTKDEVQYGYFGTTIIEGINSIDRDRFITQELHLTSRDASHLRWQTGLFFYDNDISATFDQTLQSSGAKLHIGGIDKKTRNIGAFGEATYDITDNTRITGGVRYDYTRVAVNETDCNTLTGTTKCATLSGADGVRKWRNWTYRARIEHDLSAGNMLYASVSSAFLPGDVAIVTGSGGTLKTAAYDAENLTAYEVGSKNRLLGGKLTLNAAAFYYDYGGFQQPVQIGQVGTVTLYEVGNSKARMLGGEMEAQFQPSKYDRFSVNANYVDAYFIDKPATFAAGVSQKTIPRITPFQATASYSRTVFDSELGSLQLKVEGQFYSAHDVAILTATQAASAIIRSLARQGDVLLGNLYATWESPWGFLLSGYVRNFTDKRYINRVETSGTTTQLNAYLGAPRTVGIVANAKF